jgi:uncharacterized protein
MKKCFCLLLCVLLLTGLTVSVCAAQLPRVNDYADLLDEYDEQSLTEMADAIAATYGMDAVVLTVDNMGGQDAQSFADDFYDSNGYSADGVIMVLAMEEREYYISTCGEAIHALTDYALYQMEEAFLDELSDGDYFDAFHSYLWDVNYYLEQFYADAPVDGYIPEEDRYTNHTDVVYYDDEASYEDLAGTAWLISIGIGLVVGGIGLLIMRIGMNTKRLQHSAVDYVLSGGCDLTEKQDIFLYSRVTKQKKPEPSDNDNRGGSGVHTASSGRSHGGRGGKF